MVTECFSQRFRVNGKVAAVMGPNAWLLNVQEAFPNCPKVRRNFLLGFGTNSFLRAQYIQKRVVKAVTATEASSSESTTSAHLSNEQVAQIANADTFFIASQHPTVRLLPANLGHALNLAHRSDWTSLTGVANPDSFA